MSKIDEPQALAPLHESDLQAVRGNVIDISELMWMTRDEGMIPLKMIDDSHLRNIALMLIGMGYQQYNATDGHKIRWLTALRMEWEKRQRERKTNFKKK